MYACRNLERFWAHQRPFFKASRARSQLELFDRRLPTQKPSSDLGPLAPLLTTARQLAKTKVQQDVDGRYRIIVQLYNRTQLSARCILVSSIIMLYRVVYASH